MAGAALPGRLTSAARRGRRRPIAETPTREDAALGCRLAGHRAGQHVDVRLTAEDGYQAQRSYSIASRARGERSTLTVERLDDGEVSPYLVGELGGATSWSAGPDRRLLRLGAGRRPVLLSGGSGIVPLMAMAGPDAAGGDAPSGWLTRRGTGT